MAARLELDDLRLRCLCCACGGSMIRSPHINLIGIPRVRATWQSPTLLNFGTGEGPRAVAIVCDDCICHQREITKVVEFAGTAVIYHDVSALEAK